MLHDIATWTFFMLMLWAGGALVIAAKGKPAPPAPQMLPPKNPIGFMPPPA